MIKALGVHITKWLVSVSVQCRCMEGNQWMTIRVFTLCSAWVLLLVGVLVSLPVSDVSPGMNVNRFMVFLMMNLQETMFRGHPSCSRYLSPPCSMNPVIDSLSSPMMPTKVGSRRDRVFHDHAVNNTVMVVQMNLGFVNIGLNLLASLYAAGDGTDMLTRRVVVWAMTNSTALALKTSQKQMGFGVYVEREPHPVTNLAPSEALESGGTTSYYDMMRSRARFFLHVIEDLGLGLFFVDGDVVFLRDPWPLVVWNNGLGVSPSSRPDPYASVEPDIVYAADASGMFDAMDMPFQGFYSVVPRICGGLFFARPTVNAVKVYQDLERAIWESEHANDQWTMDELLADGRDVLLTGPLTGGLCRRRSLCRISNDTLRIRILDQQMFKNARVFEKDIGRPWNMSDSVSVSLHVNMWNINKTSTLMKMGLWHL